MIITLVYIKKNEYQKIVKKLGEKNLITIEEKDLDQKG